MEKIKTFKEFNNLFYSLDFIFDENQKPYILEINSRPAFIIGKDDDKKFFDGYYKEIVDYFLNID